MKKSLKKKFNQLTNAFKKRLAFLVSSTLAMTITSLVLVGGVSAAVVTYRAVLAPEEKPVEIQIQTNKEQPKDVVQESLKTEEPAEPTIDPNHQDLAPEQYKNTEVSRDNRYGNVHDVSQDALPTCVNGWQYIASNGDFTCIQNDCNYAFLTRVKDGVDETTIGLSPGVRGGVGCSHGATAAEVWSTNNVTCQDGTQDCVTSTIVDVKRNPGYVPPSGQE